MVSSSNKFILVLGVWTLLWTYVVKERLIPEVVTVDIASITESFIKQEAQKTLSTQEKKQAVTRFSHQLEGALDKIAKAHHHIIIFPREAVLKGSKDYTNQVR